MREEYPAHGNRQPIEDAVLKVLTRKEWKKLYEAWRPPYAHLPKEVRVRIVRGCAGKVLYEIWAEAHTVAVRLPGREGKQVSIYRCDICRHYHIGNTGDRQRGKPNSLRGLEKQERLTQEAL